VPDLRPYQRSAKASVRKAYREGLHRVGISLPTGTGKTNIMCSLAADLYAKQRSSIIVVHRDQLVRQTKDALELWVPAGDIGVVQANKNQFGAPVVVASAQTIQNMDRLSQLPPYHLYQFDEAHVTVSDSYMRIHEAFGLLPGGDGFAVGYTATWMRSDKRGLGDIWEDIVFRRSIKWAVRHGYLAPPRAIQCGEDVPLALDKLKATEDGEYTDRSAAEVVMVEDLRDAAVKAYLNLAAGRSAALFAPTKEAVRWFLEGFREHGITTAEYMSVTGKNERKFAMTGFNNGAIKVLGTCHALAEGWDSPRCDCIILLNPVRLGRFVQIFGRALRPWPGKRDGLLLDLVRATDDVALRSVIDLSATPAGASQEELDEISEVEEAFKIQQEREEQARLVKKTHQTREVDLFAGTDARWLTTDQGIPFINTRNSIYFVNPNADEMSWDVGIYSRGKGKWLARGLPPSEALDVASDAALTEDHSVASRRASWRRGGQKPTESQLEYARRLGINPIGMSRAEVADAISVATASQILSRLDRRSA
jgi:superfamily II DNA or RNA helicase